MKIIQYLMIFSTKKIKKIDSCLKNEKIVPRIMNEISGFCNMITASDNDPLMIYMIMMKNNRHVPLL